MVALIGMVALVAVVIWAAVKSRFLASAGIVVIVIGLGMLALTAAATVAQSLPPGPRFEVASVRVAPSSNGLPEGFAMNPRRAGGRLSWTTNLYSLVRYAYHVPSWCITGITPEQFFYRIDASMEATAGQEEVRSMLRQLLIDRFKLTTHTRVEQRSGYALVIVNGPKLQRAAATGEVAQCRIT